MTTFFLGGCMRSGTSLLTSVLCSGPATNPVIGEVQYLKRMLDLHVWGRANFSYYLKDSFADIDDFESFTRTQIEGYLARTARRWPGRAHLVLKNPEIIQHFPELGAFVEDSKFLVTVRDPRDTVASMMEVARKQKAQGVSSTLTGMSSSIAELARFYNAYYLRLLRGDFTDLRARLLVVRYEDLVTRPSQILGDLAAFTGLALADFDPDSEWRRSSHDYDELRRDPRLGAWTTELYGKAVSDRSIGRYRDLLTPAETETIEERCKGVMRLFRYGDEAAARPPT